MNGDEEDKTGFASPPCFLHETDPKFRSLAAAADPQQRADVMRWRKAERERLIATRVALPAAERQEYGTRIAAVLEEAMGAFAGLTVSAYWPFRGEPDLRPLLARIAERGGRTALPVVVERRAPLIFRAWRKGDPLERGIWNIPVPAESAPTLLPDVVIAPLVGFDPAGYRLGYGGGFFDRTLASLPKRPRVFGVGYETARIATIYPQPHDIPMDAIITEKGLHEPLTAA